MTQPTTFASIRIVTDDVAALVSFYEHVTGMPAAWATAQFAEIRTDAGTLAIAGTSTLAVFGTDIAQAGTNLTVIIELAVSDVDSEYDRLKRERQLDLVQQPTTMPWGNRSLLVRDP